MAGHTVASADQNSSRATSALHVNLYSNKTGFFFESLFISIFTSALLIIFSLSFEAHGFMLMSGEIIPLNGDFVAGLVLLFPALAVTIIIQRDSHRLESRTFAVQRLFVLVVAISSAAASLPITLGVSEDDARRYWYTAAITCWILTARIVLSSLIHSWRISHARHRISMKWRSIQKNRNHQPDYQ
jgi:hypothetical protein